MILHIPYSAHHLIGGDCEGRSFHINHSIVARKSYLLFDLPLKSWLLLTNVENNVPAFLHSYPCYQVIDDPDDDPIVVAIN